jgi:hypothetical protein
MIFVEIGKDLFSEASAIGWCTIIGSLPVIARLRLPM